MTDNEIVRGVEVCINTIVSNCSDCPYCKDKNCTNNLTKDLLDLINRQKAEIERLEQNLKEAHIDIKEKQAEIDELEAEVDRQYEQAEADILGNLPQGGASCHWCIDKHQAYARKEFAERLKELYTDEDITDDMYCPIGVIKANIDDIVKEMECK